MLSVYRSAAADRDQLGIPPLPLTAPQTKELTLLLEKPPVGEAEFLKYLIVERVSPGVDPAAKVKAEWLGAVAHGEKFSPVISRVTSACRGHSWQR